MDDDLNDLEIDPLMDERTGIRNTTQLFLRSFSILSDDSDFDELDDIDGPDGTLDDTGEIESDVHHTNTSGVHVEFKKCEQQGVYIFL